jgi:hypothetical protein
MAMLMQIWQINPNAKDTIFCVCLSVCVCVCVCVCVSVRQYVSTFLNRSSPNLEGTFYGSWHVSCAIYVVCARNAHACACVLNARAYVHLHIFERILSKGAGNILRHTLSGKDYVLFMFAYLMDGFSSNLRWTYYTSQQVAWATYLSCPLTARTRASARVRARVVKTFTHIWTDSLHICWAHTTDNHTLHGLHTYHVHAPRAHARPRVCERARD